MHARPESDVPCLPDDWKVSGVEPDACSERKISESARAAALRIVVASVHPTGLLLTLANGVSCTYAVGLYESLHYACS